MTLWSDSPYVTWNDALAKRFFYPEVAGQDVYLFVTDEVVQEIGRPIGGGLDEFITALRTGPPGSTRAGYCQRALQVAEHWRSRGLAYPPYIAYLALFVLAGGREGDFDPRSYYPRLWSLLREPESGTPPSFDRMLELWDDLERWSVQDRHGELGIFEARKVGGKIHIGLPLAQTLLTEAERRALPGIFADSQMDPGSVPSDRELRRALRVHGAMWLSRRTMSELERASPSFLEALLDVVADAFVNWDGQAPESDSARLTQQAVAAGLRICLAVDRVAGRATASLRCRSKKELPEAGLAFRSPSGERLACSSYLPWWSRPLLSATTDLPYVPPSSVWRDGIKLTDSAAHWSAQLRSARVRAFVDGRSEQLPGLIEVLYLPRRTPFYLASHDSDYPALMEWAQRDCEGFQLIEIASGLPPGWMLASVQEARSDIGPRALDDNLRFPDRRTLRLVGGIRSAPGNTYFWFARPQVGLEGGLPNDLVVCNGEELKEDPENHDSYRLQPNLPPDTRLLVEVRNGNDVVRRTSLYLVSGFEWRLDIPIATFDGFGRSVSGQQGIAGASAPSRLDISTPPDLLRTPGLQLKAPRIYFIGRSPGQIAMWPDQPLPNWDPVWAVPFGKRGRAVFCGASVPEARPIAGADTNLNTKAWHQFLWRSRKKIKPPDVRSLRRLWREYIQAARDA